MPLAGTWCQVTLYVTNIGVGASPPAGGLARGKRRPRGSTCFQALSRSRWRPHGKYQVLPVP